MPNHKSFPNENKQKTKFISLTSKYSRTHTITTSVFERDIPLDLWCSLKGCKKDIWSYLRGAISTPGRSFFWNSALNTTESRSCKKSSHKTLSKSHIELQILYILWHHHSLRGLEVLSPDSAHPAAYGELFNGGSMQEVGKVAVGGSWFPNDQQTYQTIPSKNYIQVWGNSLIILELLT
jgi:hypothetical protein